jgi:hypothetical protein
MIFPQASSCAHKGGSLISRAGARSRTLPATLAACAAAQSAADGGARFFCPRARAHDTITTYRVIELKRLRLLSTEGAWA